MKLKCIACDALARPVYLCAARSPHIVDVQLVPRGLHIHPDDLRARLQALIAEADESGYDAILLAYGLCGKASAGLVAQKTALVLPRAHDCITLFLGSRQRYRQQFESCPGTYWYAQDYIERDDGSGGGLSLGSGADLDFQVQYDEYVRKYGKDNADYLMEVMGAWRNHYQRAAYIDLGIADGSKVEAQARAEALKRNWTFERIVGDIVLIRRLIEGDWNEPANDDFLIIPTGGKIDMTNNEDIVCCVQVS